MNSEVCGDGAVEGPAGVKAGDPAAVVLAGLRVQVEVGSINISTNQPFCELTIPKGGESYATGRSNRPPRPGPQNGSRHGKMRS